MSSTGSPHFYTNLNEYRQSISRLLQKEELFEDVPSDWHVVITDILDSTQSINSGNHEVVNLIATGSIIAVLNIAHEAKITIPFWLQFFCLINCCVLLSPHSILQSLYSVTCAFRERALYCF